MDYYLIEKVAQEEQDIVRNDEDGAIAAVVPVIDTFETEAAAEAAKPETDSDEYAVIVGPDSPEQADRATETEGESEGVGESEGETKSETETREEDDEPPECLAQSELDESVTHAEVRFYPQHWVYIAGDAQACESAEKDPVTFTVPVEAVLADDGEIVPDDSSQSDGLRRHENSPEWVQSWTGPFYVTIEGFLEDDDPAELDSYRENAPS